MNTSTAPTCYAVDCSTPLTLSMVRAIKAHGIQTPDGETHPVAGIGRYVSLHRPNFAWDISREELKIITGEGLGCWLVQHVRYGVGSKESPLGWTPSGQLGGFDGALARRHANLVEYPDGAHLFLDLEGVNPSTTHASVADHCAQWALSLTAAAGLAATYLPGLYDGYSPVLAPEEMWSLPDFRIYWSDFGNRVMPHRGFALKQIKENVTIGGVLCDVNQIAPDSLGGQLVWCVA